VLYSIEAAHKNCVVRTCRHSLRSKESGEELSKPPLSSFPTPTQPFPKVSRAATGKVR
jgi:hypothetical protein